MITIPNNLFGKYLDKPKTLLTLVVLYCIASDKEETYGQVDMSCGNLAKKLELPYAKVRQIVESLEKDEILTRTTSPKGTIFTLLLPNTKKKAVAPETDWRKHPLLPKDFNGTWDEALKIVLQPRRDKFAGELRGYLNEYGNTMLNDFYSYWTEAEQKKEGTKLSLVKMRFEKQDTWELSKRLTTWAKRNNGK